MGAARSRRLYDDLASILRRMLDGDDRIGALGHDRARRDLNRDTGGSALAGGRAGRRLSHDGKPSPGDGVVRTHGETVHRRARERRQIDRSDSWLCKHAARCTVDWDSLGRGRTDRINDQSLRVVK